MILQTGPKSETTVSNVNGEIYQQDGDYIKDIEVNDLRNRYTLTKGATQKMVNNPVTSADTPHAASVSVVGIRSSFY